MTQTFNCPSCGASLDYAGGDEPVVRCSYCDDLVIVPEGLRSERHAEPRQPVWTAAPLTIDLSGLTDKIASLKAIKQLVREGQEAEAARMYQDAFGSSVEEARAVVERLASGQGVVISSATFSTPVPVATSMPFQVVTGQQAVEVWTQQMAAAKQRQSRVNRAVTCLVIAIVIAVLAVVVFAAVGNSIVDLLLQ